MPDAVEHVAPARLHWGLFHLPGPGIEAWPAPEGLTGRPVRQFGGVGLMIDRPVTRVRATRHHDSDFGPDERVRHAARLYLDSIGHREEFPWRLELVEGPEPHAGLGSGTQLALAVGRVLEQCLGREREPSEKLAQRVGRGDRSAVGIHGSERGGLIVDAGKLPGQPVAALAGAYEFPDDWRVVLCFPESGRRWHGERERRAFHALEAGDSRTRLRNTEQLSRLVLLDMIPALLARDFAAFAASTREYNARSGDDFAAVQGGRYADPAIAAMVDRCTKFGFPGCGQSSWGPAVFALCPDEGAARWLASKVGGEVARGWRPGMIDRRDAESAEKTFL